MTIPEAEVDPKARLLEIKRDIRSALDVEKSTADIAEAKAAEQRFNHDEDHHRWRRTVGIALGIVTFVWIVGEMLVILSEGLGIMYGAPFKLSDNVIIAFLTTATASIIGLFAIFMRWLFHRSEETKMEDKRG